MLDSITHPLRFPPYRSVAHHESEGNWAIKKYYQWPYRYFYRHKIRMIERALRGKRYEAAIDFGSGPGILTKQWFQYVPTVHCVDKHYVMPKDKVGLIICSSVMEFVDDLDETFKSLAEHLNKDGDIVVASPMDTDITKIYFSAIGDRELRHSHQDILSSMSRYFNIRSYKTWAELYFCAMGKPK